MPQLSPSRPFVTAPEAFEALGIDRSTGYRLIRRGAFPLPVVRVGNQIRIPTAALERLRTTGVAAAFDAPRGETGAPVGHDGRSGAKEN